MDFRSSVGLLTKEDGFSARPPLEGQRAQLTGQLRFERVRMDIAHGVKETGHLLLAGANDARVGVPGGGHSEGSREIQIFASFGIPNMNAPRAFPNNWP